MKYKCSIDINLGIDQVVKIWDDPENFKYWQNGFQSIELLSGESNTPGAKSKILLLNGKMEIELIETILVSNLPHEKTALYEHKHMTNTQTTRFISKGENKTQYISEVEYTKFNGLMIKLMAKLFPSKFKAQSQQWLDQFKEFSESVSQ